VTSFRSTLIAIWRLAIPYFRSEDRGPALALLGSVVALELTAVGITVLGEPFTAVQGIAFALALAGVVLATLPRRSR